MASDKFEKDFQKAMSAIAKGGHRAPLDPFVPRKQVGRGGEKWIVAHKRKGRVTVHPFLTRQSAQVAADDLNIAERVRPYDEDSRPYDIRRAEARREYYGDHPEAEQT